MSEKCGTTLRVVNTRDVERHATLCVHRPLSFATADEEDAARQSTSTLDGIMFPASWIPSQSFLCVFRGLAVKHRFRQGLNRQGAKVALITLNVAWWVWIISLVCLLIAFRLPKSFGDERQAEVSPAKSPVTVDRTPLDPSWLSDVKHPQTGLLSRNVRPEEGVGYFAILNHARELPLQDLKDAAKRFERERFAVVKNDPSYRFYFRKPDAKFPTFVDLFRAPAAYHGQPVTFRGHVRRIISFSAGENAHGFQQLHEVWLYAGESQQNPVVIICPELPPGIPIGPDLLVDFVSATGYFFKRYGYEDRLGQTRFAPLILAQRLEWNPPAKRAHWLSTTAVFSLPVGIAILIAIICWRSSRQDRSAIRRIAESGDHGVDVNPFADKPH